MWLQKKAKFISMEVQIIRSHDFPEINHAEIQLDNSKNSS